jgi:hypothetical protein
MTPAEFEEKEYEGPLYSQLERGDPRLWSPGQVLEEYLGFDRALFLVDDYLWNLHGLATPLAGIIPRRFRWPFLPRSQRYRSRLPTFGLNCFIQAKRPSAGSRLPRKLTALGNHRPFFRFGIDTDQQRTLEAAAHRLRKKALFLYASPAFATSKELFRHMTAASLVQHSTFPDVASLAGHRAWYYNRPGSVGIANQDYESLELPSLDAHIASLLQQADVPIDATPSTGLAQLLTDLKAIILESSDLADEPRVAYLAEEWRRQEALADTPGVPPAVVAFLGVEAFVGFLNLSWLTIG